MNEGIESYYAGRRAIVLGGAGFIGSRLATALVGLNARTAVVDGFLPGTGACERNLADVVDRVEMVRANISEVDVWKDLLDRDTIIFHCAARNTHRICNLDPAEDAAINLLPQYPLLNLLAAASAPARLVYTGTRTVYDPAAPAPVHEGSPLAPQDLYSLHTRFCEGLFEYAARRGRLEFRCARLTNCYGPGQRLSGGEIGLIGEIIRSALLDEPYVVFGDGSATRDVNHVDDVTEALLRLGAAEGLGPSVTVNLGGDRVSTKRIVDAVARAAGWSGARYETDRPAADIPALDISYARSLLGWEPAVDATDGIRNTVDYFRRNRDSYIGIGND